MSDIDQQARTLIAAAADDIPPGIDLVSGFRARRATRRARVRVQVTLAAVVACVAAAASVITLTIAQAPSALAQVTSAVSRTTGQSYDFNATITRVPLQPGDAAPTRATVSGAFNPPQRLGEETLGPVGQVRFVGGFVYLPIGSVARSTAGPLYGKSWLRAPSALLATPMTANQQLRIPAGILSVSETSPQNLFTLFKTASMVDRQGSVSGPGWTGTRYTFSVRIAMGPAGSGVPTVTATGTLDVDQQGRVRHLAATYELPAIASAGPQRITVEMTFSDFGAPVSVSVPPASEVFTPANINGQAQG
jgi:hypothetical protein